MSFKITIFKVLFWKGGGGGQKEYSVYTLDNVDNSGRPLKKGKGNFYIAQYPVRWAAQSVLHFTMSANLTLMTECLTCLDSREQTPVSTGQSCAQLRVDDATAVSPRTLSDCRQFQTARGTSGKHVEKWEVFYFVK